jgi:3-phenylpropionate/cinnamic acid dioxygenase small subunit
MVAILEMTDHSSQSPRDRVLWILSEHGGQLERSILRRYTGMRYALLDPVLEELARDGKIRIEEEIVTLASR